MYLLGSKSSTKLALCIALGANIGYASALRPSAAERSADQQICGPRCVKYVLDYFQKDSECTLVDLVRELQWPDIDRGSSLAAIESALHDRGIYTKALYVSPANGVQWPYPIIAHCRGDRAKLGHFVVVLPSSDPERVTVRGLRGAYEMSRRSLVSQMSGAILLTSGRPIHTRISELLSWKLSSRLQSRLAAVDITVILCAVVFLISVERFAGTRFGFGRPSIPPTKSEAYP